MDLRPLDWSDYLRVFDLPSGLLANGNRNTLRLTAAWIDDEPVSSALTFDFAGDCGIYNVGTLEHARRPGLATSFWSSGCRSVGCRDLGRPLEYVHQTDVA